LGRRGDGGGRHCGWRRAGARWIGGPPRCCTRVRIAVIPRTDGCLRIGGSLGSLRSFGISTARVGSDAAGLRRVGIVSLAAAPIVRSARCRVTGQWLAFISAHRKPASSRATAVATTDFTFLRAARTANRRHSRVCAVHDRATVAGVDPVLSSCDGGAQRQAVLVGPGRLAQLAADMAVAGVGDRASQLAQPSGVLRAGQGDEGHERPGVGETPPVEHLSPQAQRPHMGDTPVGPRRVTASAKGSTLK
jgi:hypothetical protein